MNKGALFTDGTASYVVPAEPEVNEVVSIFFRTAKEDVEEVHLLTGDGEYLLRKSHTKGEFDYYVIRYQLREEMLVYQFRIKGDGEVCFYNRCGVAKEIEKFYAFVIRPGFHVPQWAKGAVMYQIFVDRFCNGDKSNDVESGEYIYLGEPCERVVDWEKCPAHMGVREFYGGDLQGVLDKLDYLEDLGVEVVYFNPLFVSPSNHKYDIQDYDYIDPHYGVIINDDEKVLSYGEADNKYAEKYRVRTADKENLEASNQLFIRLVEELHKRGMKVILDGVFNHCGSFNKWMDRERLYETQEAYEKGAYVSADSPYRSFFRFYRENEWPYNGSYDGWWGHDTLPKLNYEASVKLEQYILEVARKWVSPPYNVDGWRLDVAADLGHSNEYNHMFWEKFRKAVKEANKEAIILAEHYGDPSDWLQGSEWDTVMNYDAFMEPITWFLTGLEKHSDEARPELYGNPDHFVGAINHHMANMMTPSLQVAMNELSNHDHSRFLTRTNHMVGRASQLGYEAASEYVSYPIMREAVIFQMTWVGAPTIYYGDEAGVCGFTDPDNRRTYPWGKENKELIEFHKEMISFHKRHACIKTGSLLILTCGEHILSYGRFNQKDQVIVIINNRPELAEVTVPVWRLGVPMKGKLYRYLYSYNDDYTTSYEEILVDNGEIVVNMGRHSALILENQDHRGW